MRASSTSWKRLPFTNGVAVPSHSAFSAQQLSQLVGSLIPRMMEDKWFIDYEEPHPFFHRGWAGQPVYRVKFRHSAEGAYTKVSQRKSSGG